MPAFTNQFWSFIKGAVLFCVQNGKFFSKADNKVLYTTPTNSPAKSCNCKKATQCPLDSTCLTDNPVYEAKIKAPSKQTKKYIGMTEHSFKSRFNNHKQSLKHEHYANSTALSAYTWELKRSGVNYNMKWSILKRAKAYTAGAKQCNSTFLHKFYASNFKLAYIYIYIYIHIIE